ncbi:MAG: 2-hydroxyglutaryl-CoA dehydratase [Thermotoga sp.]|nr:MAG: 2-hydroxyglutaryl-CoA dehydratase [Thermotoga sp.]
MKMLLGIDVGSVSTDIAILNEEGDVLTSRYLRTKGNPIEVIKRGLGEIEKELNDKGIEPDVAAVGTTGSARYLAGVVVGADLVKNEISAHAFATIRQVPEVRTIFEIGGQDSKIILIRDKIVIDFGMNSVCAAGTGSFLDHQAERLGIDITKFGDYSLKADNPVRIAGRCTVFAESDMIHKQQMGASTEDIIGGLCEALVRNYLNNVARGKELLPPFVFQGGVSENIGIKKAFEKTLNHEVIIPKNNKIMGAIGAALLAKHDIEKNPREAAFKGFRVARTNYKTRTFYCNACPNNCEVYEIKEGNKVIARWGDICGRWSEGLKRMKKVKVNKVDP